MDQARLADHRPDGACGPRVVRVCVMQGAWDAVTVINMPQDLETLATALHIASELGHAKLVQLLLEVIYH